MNQYLEKIAKQDEKLGLGYKAGIAYASATVGSIGGAVTAAHLGKSLNNIRESGVTEKDVAAYRKAKNLRHVHHDKNIYNQASAHYVPVGVQGNKRPIVRSSHPDISMHEFGHAHSFNESRLRGKIYSGAKKNVIHASSAATKLGVAGLVGAGMATSDNKKVRDAAPYATAAMTAPLLHEEARATLSPAKFLAKTQGKQTAARFLRNMAPAYGTYVATAAGAVGGAALAKKWANKLRENRAKAK